jgi:DNA repair protein RadC
VLPDLNHGGILSPPGITTVAAVIYPTALMAAAQALDLLARLRRRRQETLVAVLLDPMLRPGRLCTVAVGESSHVASTPREVFRPAIRFGAPALLLAHNHPWGDPEPSIADVEMTERLIRAGEIVGVELVDHLIVTREAWYSFRANGAWPPIIGT